MRERWFGATGIQVPEIAVEGEDLELPDESHARLEGRTFEIVVADLANNGQTLARAHADGVPVVVRCETVEDVKTALARPEVSCVAVPASARHLRDLDLTELTYG
jgi:NAD(P)H-dependent flavin oxidoreductase YrpB (nitropropane dioxygenase family)